MWPHGSNHARHIRATLCCNFDKPPPVVTIFTPFLAAVLECLLALGVSIAIMMWLASATFTVLASLSSAVSASDRPSTEAVLLAAKVRVFGQMTSCVMLHSPCWTRVYARGASPAHGNCASSPTRPGLVRQRIDVEVLLNYRVHDIDAGYVRAANRRHGAGDAASCGSSAHEE